MKKRLFIALGSILCLGALLLYYKNTYHSVPPKYLVGIIQSASHPALDTLRSMITTTLYKQFGNEIEIVLQNAEGSVINAHAIAHKLYANKHFDVFCTLGTLASQALSTLEKERPIVIAAVSDPSALGSHVLPPNVTGTHDTIGPEASVATLMQLVPHAQRIGILYTADQKNQVAALDRILKCNKLTPVHFAMSGEADLHALVELICRKTDAILTPVDTNVALGISLISSLALKYKRPLIVSDTMLVRFGPLAARGIDYKANGIQTAKIITQLLQGKSPSDFGVTKAIGEQTLINTKTASLLDISIDQTEDQDIVFVK